MRYKINRRRRGAFTLIEVLLVAGILAVLAAFAIPSIVSRAQKARTDICRAAIGRNGPIASALDQYNLDMGKYPDTDEGLQVLFLKKGQVDDPRFDGPYMKEGMSYEELKDPWGQPYHYRRPGEFHEDTYDLWSNGVDGKDDGGREGSDDVKNWIER